MSFFTKLSQVMGETSLTMAIAYDGKKITLSILPIERDGDKSKKIAPIVVSGEPADLDEQFFTITSQSLALLKGVQSDTKEFEKSVKAPGKQADKKTVTKTEQKEIQADPETGEVTEDDEDTTQGSGADDLPFGESTEAEITKEAANAGAKPEPAAKEAKPKGTRKVKAAAAAPAPEDIQSGNAPAPGPDPEPSESPFNEDIKDQPITAGIQPGGQAQPAAVQQNTQSQNTPDDEW